MRFHQKHFTANGCRGTRSVRVFLALHCIVSTGSFISLESRAQSPDPGSRASRAAESHIEVIGTTPFDSIAIERDSIPANARIIATDPLRDPTSIGIAESIARQLPSVNINETQGNPLQPSVNYRGFMATPLLGAPQGLSVFQDGIRINESFGDIVHWDLLPRNAIATTTLLPGSNPIFGLNTLGGAISLRTKSGDTHPGTRVDFHGGAFGRRLMEMEHGAGSGNGALYLAASRFHESGWREHSPSDARQLFGKLSYRDATRDLHLSFTRAETNLTGNGLVPASLQGAARSGVFTVPDNSRNRVDMLNLNGGLWLGDEIKVSGTLYHRRSRSRTLNGDINAGFENDATLDGAAGANGGVGFDLDTGSNNRTDTLSRTSGLALLWSMNTIRHNISLGASHDRGDSRFEQNSALGLFDPSRMVSESNAGAALRNRLLGITRTSSLFITESYSPSSFLTLSASARFNVTRVALQDQRVFTTPNLDGDHRYRKLNPAAGVTWKPADSFTAYAGFNQGTRVPSPIELGCADRANPCTLPNAMASDPFLKQVVARTIEAGIRGGSADHIVWNAGLFRTINHDDILFSGTSGSAGFFTNFGKTMRQGLELGASGKTTRWEWSGQYSLLRATFESSACLLSASNSNRGQAAECASPANDLILVSPGDRLPGLPAHNFRLSSTFRIDDRSAAGIDLSAYSKQFARGNENNRHQAGIALVGGAPQSFPGAGSTPGFAVFNLTATHAIGGGWDLFARINNLFDRRYQSGAALAENPFDSTGRFQTNSDNWTRDTFVAPGAPRAGWIGFRYQFVEGRNR